jgi:hypothetical protein
MNYDLERVTLRSLKLKRVSSFSGFQSTHRVPENSSARSQQFLAGIAEEEMKAHREEDYRSFREAFGYKRKDLLVMEEPGRFEIQTPDFTYQVSLFLDPVDPTHAVFQREITAIKKPEAIWGEVFREKFEETFTTLLYNFEKSISVEEFIDKLEEKNLPKIRIDYDSLSTWCEVQIDTLKGIFRLTDKSLSINGENLLDLFTQFKKTLSKFTKPTLTS